MYFCEKALMLLVIFMQLYKSTFMLLNLCNSIHLYIITNNKKYLSKKVL